MTQFPYHIWRKLLKEIMINDNSELFQKGNFQGDLELAQGNHVLSETVQRCACSRQPDCSGSRNGESAVFDYVRFLGEKVSIGIENPVYKNAYAILKELNFKIHPISMDESWNVCGTVAEQTDANSGLCDTSTSISNWRDHANRAKKSIIRMG